MRPDRSCPKAPPRGGKPVIVACIPVSIEARRGIPFLPHNGSSIATCAHCGERVWVGSDQQEKVNRGATVLCGFCAAQLPLAPADGRRRDD